MNRAPFIASLFGLLLSGCFVQMSPDDQGGATAPGGSTENGENPGSGAEDPGGTTSGDPGSTTGGTSGGAGGASRVIGYFAAWSVYGRDYHVNEIPADKLTHINYGFANISDEGRCTLGDPYADTDKFYEGDSWDTGAKRGSFHQLELLKAANPGLKTLISVGGWTWSGRFSDVALTAESRSKFADSCVAFMKEHGFDGIDIDWEYPVSGGLPENTTRPEDKQNYTLLLQELRSKLDGAGSTDGQSYLLTIAAPAGPNVFANLELEAVGKTVDWINLMTYDFHGGWEPITNFNAPLYASAADPTADPMIQKHFNTHSAVTGYIDGGVPADKIVLGVPFYGRGYKGVPAGNNGLYQSHSGLPEGTWEAGMFDYHDIKANYLPTFKRFWNEEAMVPWLYDEAQGIMISYDDPESIAKKGSYARENGLGGVMFWELSGDDAESSLLNAVNESLAVK